MIIPDFTLGVSFGILIGLAIGYIFVHFVLKQMRWMAQQVDILLVENRKHRDRLIAKAKEGSR